MTLTDCTHFGDLIELSMQGRSVDSVAELHRLIVAACEDLDVRPPDQSAVWRWRNSQRIPEDSFRIAIARALDWSELELAFAQRLAANGPRSSVMAS